MARRRRRAARGSPRVQADVVVVAARRDERRLVAHPLLHLEAEHARLEAERALDVRHFQVDVADVDARIDRSHRARYPPRRKELRPSPASARGRRRASARRSRRSASRARARRRARRRATGAAAQGDPHECDDPGDERKHPEQAELDAELRVGRLARLDLRPGAFRGHARVAESVALRVRRRRSMPVAEVVEVASNDDSPGSSGSPLVGSCLASCPLDLELGRGETRLGRDVGIGADEEERGCDERSPPRRPATRLRSAYASTTSPTASAAIAVREYVKSRPTASSAGQRGQPPAARCQVAASRIATSKHVRSGQRAEEGRDEPAQRPLVARVVDPVLRQAGEALAVLEPELLAEPAGHARVAPGLERDRVDVDEPPGGDDRRRRRGSPSRSAPVVAATA